MTKMIERIRRTHQNNIILTSYPIIILGDARRNEENILYSGNTDKDVLVIVIVVHIMSEVFCYSRHARARTIRLP